MNTRRLGDSDLSITPVGYGAWAIGGAEWEYGWGKQADEDSVAAILKSLEMGVNWIDTAAAYGLGHAEDIVARALSEWKEERPHVFTKCGLPWNGTGKVSRNITADSVRRECEGSLRRLKVDIIDLYQVHWPPEKDDEELEEGWATMAELQREGKVHWIGVSNFSVAQIKRAQAIAPVSSLQPPYSLIRRDVEKEILPYCQKEGIGVIVYAPMSSGLLTGAMTRERAAALPPDDWRSRSPEFTEPRLSRNLAVVDRLRAVGKRHGRSPGEAAIAWTLRNPAVTGAIVGARSVAQVEGVMRAGDFTLTGQDAAALEQTDP